MVRIDYINCNINGLKKLNKYQNEYVEHKEPITHGDAFYFSEAVGDITRELTKWCEPARSYVSEKLKRLDSINDLVVQ